MNNILVLLFAVLDSKAWSIGEMTSTVDRLITTATHPRPWLFDLCTCGSDADCLAVLRKAMQELGVFLPDDIGDLLAGLILFRFDRDDLSAEVARRHLVDVVDAYGTSCVDAEAAARLDLNDPAYAEIRGVAAKALEYLSGSHLSPTDRSLIEN